MYSFSRVKRSIDASIRQRPRSIGADFYANFVFSTLFCLSPFNCQIEKVYCSEAIQTKMIAMILWLCTHGTSAAKSATGQYFFFIVHGQIASAKWILQLGVSIVRDGCWLEACQPPALLWAAHNPGLFIFRTQNEVALEKSLQYPGKHADSSPGEMVDPSAKARVVVATAESRPNIFVWKHFRTFFFFFFICFTRDAEKHNTKKKILISYRYYRYVTYSHSEKNWS